MNEWALRTLKLVEQENYLDRLQEVYPHEDAARDVKQEVIESIRESFHNQDSVALLDKLLGLDKFPYDDSYVEFLRKDRGALERNPQTVKRICDRLYAMGVDGVISGATQPKAANQRRGNAFTDWAKSKFPRVDYASFKSSTEGVILLDASESVAVNFCNTELRIAVSKRPDLVAKSGTRYVVGEAKFSSSAGGNQAAGFLDGITLASNSHGNAHKVFILDGVYWIKGRTAQYTTLEHTAANVMSALILEEFLSNIPQ